MNCTVTTVSAEQWTIPELARGINKVHIPRFNRESRAVGNVPLRLLSCLRNGDVRNGRLRERTPVTIKITWLGVLKQSNVLSDCMRPISLTRVPLALKSFSSVTFLSESHRMFTQLHLWVPGAIKLELTGSNNTNHLDLHCRLLNNTFFIITVHLQRKSLGGCNCAQLITNGSFTRMFPMELKENCCKSTRRICWQCWDPWQFDIWFWRRANH